MVAACVEAEVVSARRRGRGFGLVLRTKRGRVVRRSIVGWVNKMIAQWRGLEEHGQSVVYEHFPAYPGISDIVCTHITFFGVVSRADRGWST